jgi:hypothetical protein
MKRAAAACLMLAFFARSVFSQPACVWGWVTDQNGQPLPNTIVRLGQTTYDNGYGQSPYITTTDYRGYYLLGPEFCCDRIVIPKSTLTRGDAFLQPVYFGGKVLFSLPQSDALVRISIYDLSGRLVRDVMNKRLSKGDYSVSIDTRGISSQLYMLRVTINGVASVMKLQPASRMSGGAVVQSSPGFETRLEKLAAAVDTLYATEPGYTIGVTPITTKMCVGYDFTLKKNTTFNGDTNAFWGDTISYPKTNGIQHVILNRTNGAFPDSQIFWSIQQNGAKTSIATQPTVQIPNGNGRLYIWVAPTDSENRYFDIVEFNFGGSTWEGNTTRAEGWRLPIAFRVHTSTGIDPTIGDAYEMFYQSRQAKFDEFTNEVPKEFTGLATQDFAHIWAPYTSPENYFNTGGMYVDYFKRYQDSAFAHYVKNPSWAADPGAYPQAPTAGNIFGCSSLNLSMASSPDWSAAINRHVATLPQGVQYANWNYNDTASYYQESPCNYFSKWCHRRSLHNLCYGFPYDAAGNHSSYIQRVNVQWVAIAVGW